MQLCEARHGARSFVVLGLCSGVDPAHAIALSDPRICGAIFVDGHAFSTPMHLVHRYVLRAGRPRAWELFLKRRVPRLFGVKEERVFEANLDFARPPMPRERFVREVARLVEQNIPLLFAFTGEQNDAFSHPEQFHAMVRPVDTRGRVEVAIYRRADHTFSMPEDRRSFVNVIGPSMADIFPLAQPAPLPIAAPAAGEAASSTRIRQVG